MIIGVDEVGRGSLAGPVCVAAVALAHPLTGLADSKVLSAAQREVLAVHIKQRALCVGIGWASHNIVDSMGLTAALRLAAQRAYAPFEHAVSRILLDGKHNYLQDARVTTIIGGDATEPAISAASIVAKVARDHYMQMVAHLHPHYGFERHVGYSTALHRAALLAHGPSPLHRLSFGFVRELTSDVPH